MLGFGFERDADGAARGSGTREPERIAPGRGVPADPGAHRARARAGAAARRLARARARSTRSCRARSAARIETAAPIARRARPRGRDRRRARSSTTRSPTTTSRWRSCARTNDARWLAMVEGRWEEFGGESPDVFRGPGRRDAVDAIVAAHPGRARRRGVPRRRHQRRARRSCSASTASSGSTRTTRRCRAWSRRAPACDRSRRSTSARTSTRRGGA